MTSRVGSVVRFVLVALVAATTAACGTRTSTTHVWQAETRSPRLAADVLVFGGRMAEATRRTVEDALARELAQRGTRATPSYRIFPQLPQRDIAQAEVKRLGFGGAVVVTLRQIRERQTYVPGYHRGFWGSYYGPGWGMAYSPGYVVTDELVTVETTVWNLRDDPGELVWASNTETRNPTSTRDFVESYVDALLPNLERDGLVPKK